MATTVADRKLLVAGEWLETGEWVKGFICEPAALADATEITQFGGWNNYLTAAKANVAAGL